MWDLDRTLRYTKVLIYLSRVLIACAATVDLTARVTALVHLLAVSSPSILGAS